MNAPGSVFFFGLTPPPPAPGTLLGASDGLSTDAATGTIAQLGQTVGRVGNPAALTEDREIPDAGHRLFFGVNDGVSNVIGFSTALGIFFANNTGQSISAFWQIGANATVFKIFTDDALDTVLSFQGGTAMIIWNEQGDPNVINKFLVDGAPWIMGSGEGVKTTVVSGVAVYNVRATDSVLLIDSTAGNVQINLDRTVIGYNRLTVKKTSADVNTVTLAPTAGTIQGFGAAAANFAFNLQGASFTIVNDTVNFFII